MELEIRKLTPDLAEAYVGFFDATPHDDLVDEHKCYCVCWCSDDCTGDYESKYLSSKEKRRSHALQCVKDGRLQGYLAYCGDQVVGWCNANTKALCIKCYSWRRYMGYVPVEKADAGLKVKSIFCFMIAPHMQKQGIATGLMERVCADAAQDGYDIVEAYAEEEAGKSNFGGPFAMYRKGGFAVSFETEQTLVMQKNLKSV